MRAAFFQEGSSRWTAGFTYLGNLLSAIRMLEPSLECFILLKPGQRYSTSPTGSAENGFEGTTLSWPKGRPKFGAYASRLSNKVTGLPLPDRTLNNYLKTHHIDVVYGSWGHYGEYSEHYTFPSVSICSWIADFEPFLFPEFYGTSEMDTIRRRLNRAIHFSDRLVVSSRTVLGDLIKYAPGVEHKSRILRFVAYVPPSTYENPPAQMVEVYHLPAKFIYLPNQFWENKNHALLLEALGILKRKQVFPIVVCTGQTHNYLNPNHYAELIRRVAEFNLHDQVYILGIVPVDHVRQLIRQSLGVLNPSFCEGWSSTVEEAKSIGKRVILSDLPVHREQDPPCGLYFNPRDAEELAAKIEFAWKEWPHGPDRAMEAEARNALPGRVREFGQTFLAILEEAIQSKTRAPSPRGEKVPGERNP